MERPSLTLSLISVLEIALIFPLTEIKPGGSFFILKPGLETTKKFIKEANFSQSFHFL